MLYLRFTIAITGEKSNTVEKMLCVYKIQTKQRQRRDDEFENGFVIH